MVSPVPILLKSAKRLLSPLLETALKPKQEPRWQFKWTPARKQILKTTTQSLISPEDISKKLLELPENPLLLWYDNNKSYLLFRILIPHFRKIVHFIFNNYFFSSSFLRTWINSTSLRRSSIPALLLLQLEALALKSTGLLQTQQSSIIQAKWRTKMMTYTIEQHLLILKWIIYIVAISTFLTN